MKIQIICSHCKSADVHRDANANWNVETQTWVLGTIFDAGYCDLCTEERSLEELEIIP